MITFLSSPKQWSGVSAVHQERAIRNWRALHNDVEVILYGDAPGTAEAAPRLGARHVPDVPTSDGGVPFFGAIAAHAAEHGQHDIQCYVNCDILFSRSILDARRVAPAGSFLMVGERVDLAEGVFVDPLAADASQTLSELARCGKIAAHGPWGADYFLFRRRTWAGLPDIVIGRGCYDNALIAWALRRRIPVLDLSWQVLALHQFHGYAHVPGGDREVFGGDDAELNRSVCQSLLGGYIPTPADATMCVRGGVPQRACARGDLARWLLVRLLACTPSTTLRRQLIRAWSGLRKVLPAAQRHPTLHELISSAESGVHIARAQ